ncbi:hypothetical protein [Spirillospora sp. NPDC029432]|uniref:hypothetical protein n=1 Tax=Spirillospora sp. NPDC029432 TaxID=3154599 RepID=UPI003455155C
MTALAALLLVVVLVYALERAHRRRPGPWPPSAGGSEVVDRDAERVRSDLRAMAGRTGAPVSGSRCWRSGPAR